MCNTYAHVLVSCRKLANAEVGTLSLGNHDMCQLVVL